MGKEDISETMYRKLEFNYRLLSFIKSIESADGISYVLKKDLAEEMECSPSLIFKTIKMLSIDGNMIEKIDKGKYKVYQTDILQYGPFANYAKFICVYNTIPNFMNLDWKEQANVLGISYNQIQRVYAWLNVGIKEEFDHK